MATIYTQIGGHEALAAVVADFYDRVLADDELAGFFTGTNMAKLKGRQVEFFAAALGGPDPYTGAPITSRWWRCILPTAWPPQAFRTASSSRSSRRFRRCATRLPRPARCSDTVETRSWRVS